MPINIRLSSEFSNVTAMLKAAVPGVKKAAVKALNKVATQSQSEIRVEMTRAFDRPTPYALNATRVSFASTGNLNAKVWLKNRQGDPQQQDTNYLYPEVFGTPRGRKAFETKLMSVGWLRSNEFLVPAKGLALDSYGNVPSGTIRSILSQAGAAGGLGYSSNKTSSSRSKRTVAKRGTYFVPQPGSGLPRGIYQRLAFGSGWGSRMIFKIVVGKPRYRPRLRMEDITLKVLRRDFQPEFDKAFKAEIAKAA